MRITGLKYRPNSDSELSRRVYFERNAQDGKSICAKFFAVFNGQKFKIGHVPGEKISVCPLTISEQKKIREEINKTYMVPPIPSYRELSNLTLSEQDEILKNLFPRGTWKMEIHNHVGKDPRFEKVVSLTLYNDS